MANLAQLFRFTKPQSLRNSILILLAVISFFVGLLLYSSNNTTLYEKTQISSLDDEIQNTEKALTTDSAMLQVDTTWRTVHVLVALCDNKYQGIVPVPEKIGNGQDPNNNLYWGCGYGIRTYFKKSSYWHIEKKYHVNDLILERVVFKHQSERILLIADAYDGKYIENCTLDFLHAMAGNKNDTVHWNDTLIGIGSHAEIMSYIGHNGLMDFDISKNISFENTDQKNRGAIILACISKFYFADYLDKEWVNPLLWTTGLMAPEAYTLHDALNAYIEGGSNEKIREHGALAYHKFQKCGVNASKKLLVTGWE
jgi:hypothetical protein